MLYDLPLEMLDIILQKSYLQWILNSYTQSRDEEVIKCLVSVDVCFNRRITRRRFKKAIWRFLNEFYRKTKKRHALIRNFENYLSENIQPKDEFIASLLSLNCITDNESHFIRRQPSKREKNAELLFIVKSFDGTKFSNFVKCLRQTNQMIVARILENGGGIIKIQLKTRGTKSIKTLLLHQRIEDLRSRTNPRPHETDKFIGQLREKGVEILNSQLDRQTVVVWIWCHSQAAIEYIEMLCESNQLRDVIFGNIQPSASELISIDRNQFSKAIVVFPISINFTRRIEKRGTDEFEFAYGVAKLGNRIYALCHSSSSPSVIRVFKDQHPFRLQNEIEIKEIKHPFDISSNKKENYLYVSDLNDNCFWKITRKTNNEHRIMKWLTTDYRSHNMSVSSDGQLLVVSYSSSILRIYASDAELIRSIQLPKDVGNVVHAVETSTGNFIIIHDQMEEKEEENGSGGRVSGVSELTQDGQMVIRRFSPSSETQQLNFPMYLSLDSDDRVFVSDRWNDRVILLDSDLKWNRILCPTIEETEETKIRRPHQMFYDDENKQLNVGGYEGVNVYTLSRN